MIWTSISKAGHGDGTRIGEHRPDGSSRGTVLIVPGRGDSLELREPVVDALAQRGFGVVMVEHRGQGASGHLGRHRDAVHIDSFATHLRDVDGALDRTAGPVHVLAHSMGGLIGALLLARHPCRFSSAVFTSPMWGWAGPVPNRAVAAIARQRCRCGRDRDFAVGEAPFDLEGCVAMRTAEGLELAPPALIEFGRSRRDLVRGGSTWGWTRAASAMMDELRRTDLGGVNCRVTVVSCRRDRTVSRAAHRRTARRFASARLVELDAGHDPFFARGDSARRLWSLIDRSFE